MSEVIPFRGAAELTAHQNLNNFIAQAKKLFIFKSAEWADDIWDVHDQLPEGYQLKRRRKAYFKSWKDNKSSQTINISMQEPFKSAAKAIFAEDMRLKSKTEYGRAMRVIQAVEQALIDLGKPACFTEVDDATLNYAATLIKDRNKKPWALGRILERLVKDLIEPAKITSHRLNWKSPFPFVPPPRSDRVNDESKSHKLPPLQHIMALGEIHHTSQHIPDRVVSNWVVLAMHAPSRMTEILSLPLDCITSADSEEGPIVGLRWRPVKKGLPSTKFAASDSSSELTISAIRELTEIGANARKAAKWYEENPGSLYLPEGFEHLRGQALTTWEIIRILGKEKPIRACDATSKFSLEVFGTSTTLAHYSNKALRPDKKLNSVEINLYSFQSLENWVLKRLHHGFPLICTKSKLKFSNALFTLPANILRPDADTLEYVPDSISNSQLMHQLGANPDGMTIFSRNNKVNDDGSPIKITSHQFRHLLNTLAQSKYLSQSLIAFWSGRKNVSQNQWYNHLPQDAYIEAYRLLDDEPLELHVEGPLKSKAETVASKNQITYKEALQIETGAVHSTRYGTCRHDYALTPCPKDKDCINCGEHVFVKGRENDLKEANYQLALYESNVSKAKKAFDDGIPGAKRWLDLHTPKLKRWQLAVQMLNDPKIVEGTLVTLPPPEVSQSKTGLVQAVRDMTPEKILADQTASDADLLRDLGMI